MATIQNITIDQDCDYTETLTVKDSTGTVVTEEFASEEKLLPNKFSN